MYNIKFDTKYIYCYSKKKYVSTTNEIYLKNLNTAYCEQFQCFSWLLQVTFLLSKNANNAESFHFPMQYLNCSNPSHCSTIMSFPFLKERYL